MSLSEANEFLEGIPPVFEVVIYNKTPKTLSSSI